MRSVPDFTDEMAIRLRMLGLLVSKHFTISPTITCADVARATQNAQAELTELRAGFEAEIGQQLRRARSLSQAANYLEGQDADLTDLPDDLRRAIQPSTTAAPPERTPEITELGNRMRRSHHDAAAMLAAQRAYLERATSTARMAIDDGRIAMLKALVMRRDTAALALLTAAYREREARLQAHKAKFNGEGLAQQIAIEQERERQRSRQHDSRRDSQPRSDSHSSATHARAQSERLLEKHGIKRGCVITKGQ